MDSILHFFDANHHSHKPVKNYCVSDDNSHSFNVNANHTVNESHQGSFDLGFVSGSVKYENHSATSGDFSIKFH